MADDRALAQKLVQALRRIEADAEGALLHGGALRKTLEAIRDAAGQSAADAAKELGMPPYGATDKPA
jgi:hypothetical protein